MKLFYIISTLAAGAVLNCAAEITRCGHYDGVQLQPDLTVDSAVMSTRLDLRSLSQIEPASIQFDRLGDSTLHMTINGPCRYDLLTHGDTTLLHRIERPGRFIQFDNLPQVAPAQYKTAVNAHMRMYQSEHFRVYGQMQSQLYDNRQIITTSNDTVSNLNIQVYRFSGRLNAANYKYQIEDSLLSVPAKRTLALWYNDDILRPYALWIETETGDSTDLRRSAELYVYEPSAAETAQMLQAKGAAATTPSHDRNTIKQTDADALRELKALSEIDIRTDVASGTITMQAPAGTATDILLCDMQGRVYYNGSIGERPINLTALPPGEYILSTKGTQTDTRKISLR